MSGGDTVKSNKLSFTITSIGFSKKLVYRNKVKKNDDIYVTGNLGDSFMGLKILKNKISSSKIEKKYFEMKYYSPDLHLEFSRKLHSFANSSIDISDGLIDDLDKLINKQKLSYRLHLKDIPISTKLRKILYLKKLNKLDFVSQGDDYQILFTASKSKSRIINETAKSLGIKISKIGNISSTVGKSEIIDQKGEKTALKLKGYTHKF